MLEVLEKDKDVEISKEGKKKRGEVDAGGNHQAMKIELEKFGTDLSSPI